MCIRDSGKALDIPVITYNQITSGGNVEFNMADTPSDWASDYLSLIHIWKPK